MILVAKRGLFCNHPFMKSISEKSDVKYVEMQPPALDFSNSKIFPTVNHLEIFFVAFCIGYFRKSQYGIDLNDLKFINFFVYSLKRKFFMSTYFVCPYLSDIFCFFFRPI